MFLRMAQRMPASAVTDGWLESDASFKLRTRRLAGEGIAEENTFVTGNTIVDAVYQNIELARKKVDVLKDLGLTAKQYLLLTLHTINTALTNNKT